MTVSVIVPVYNAEKYLDECVRSVLAQTFTDWELILVDDGATDGSGAICDGYANSNEKIRVDHQENAGPEAARNAGLDAARGKYIAFLDADDHYEPRYLEAMCGAALAHGADICVCDYTRGHAYGEQAELYANESLSPGFTQWEGPRGPLAEAMSANAIANAVWNKLFRADLLKNYPPAPSRERIGEDRVFVLRYLPHCRSCYYIPERLYFYRDAPESLTGQWNFFDNTCLRYSGRQYETELAAFERLGIPRAEMERRFARRADRFIRDMIFYAMRMDRGEIAAARRSLRRIFSGEMIVRFRGAVTQAVRATLPGPLYLLPRLCFRLRWATGFLFFTRLIKRIVRGLGK